MVPCRLRFSLELVENSLPLDAESPSSSQLVRSARKGVPLDKHIVNFQTMARLLPMALLIGQSF